MSSSEEKIPSSAVNDNGLIQICVHSMQLSSLLHSSYISISSENVEETLITKFVVIPDPLYIGVFMIFPC